MTDTAETPAISTTGWVRDQTETILATGTTASVHVFDRPVVLVTLRAAKSGRLRYVPLMRVEHGGAYALVASRGGAPTHPAWYAGLVKHPRVTIQDGTETATYDVRELEGAERDAWWERAVAAYPPYAEYQEQTDRLIPVLLAEPAA